MSIRASNASIKVNLSNRHRTTNPKVVPMETRSKPAYHFLSYGAPNTLMEFGGDTTLHFEGTRGDIKETHAGSLYICILTDLPRLLEEFQMKGKIYLKLVDSLKLPAATECVCQYPGVETCLPFFWCSTMFTCSPGC